MTDAPAPACVACGLALPCACEAPPRIAAHSIRCTAYITPAMEDRNLAPLGCECSTWWAHNPHCPTAPCSCGVRP